MALVAVTEIRVQVNGYSKEGKVVNAGYVNIAMTDSLPDSTPYPCTLTPCLRLHYRCLM